MTGAIADFCLARRHGLFAAAVVGSLLLGGGIFGLGFDSSLDALLTRGDPYVAELEQLEAEFPDPAEIIFAFLAPEGESVFTPRRLAAIAELGDRHLEIPLAARHSSLLDYYSPRNLRRLFARDFRDYSAAELGRLAESAQADDLLTGNLLMGGASLAFSRIRLNADFSSESQRLEAAAAALAMRDA